MNGRARRGDDVFMVPRRILAASALVLAGLFAVLVFAQGQALSADQLQGLSVAALVAASGAALVAQAGTFASAARWYIALLVVGLTGAVAAMLVRERPGDALGLVACAAAALGCAARVVRRTARRPEEAFVACQRAVPALRRLARRIEAQTNAVLAELPAAEGRVRSLLFDRLGQLAGQLQFAEGWSQRLGLGAADPVRRKLGLLRSEVSEKLGRAAPRAGR
jgi:hypothetical protein